MRHGDRGAAAVIDPPAAGDGLPGAVIDPGHGGGKVPVPDVAAQADAGLIEHGNAVEGAEPLPDQEFAAILSCGYYIASYEKPDFAKGQAFESSHGADFSGYSGIMTF